MGRALAVQLAKLDCAVAISDVVDEKLQETESLIKDHDVKVTRHPVDVSDSSVCTYLWDANNPCDTHTTAGLNNDRRY